MKIGIGVTVHNRNETAKKSVAEIIRFAPANSKLVVVDDASKIPFEGATHRFDVNVGIAQAKNKCFELLDDCEYIFLFDDDCFPKTENWHLPYIESGVNHLSFTFDKLFDGRPNGNNLIGNIDGLNVFRNPCGCMCFYTKKCLEEVGGFNPIYKKYGYEHVDLSVRIHNAGLTPAKFVDVPNSLDLFTSLDYFDKIASSVHNKSEYSRVNQRYFNQSKLSKQFVNYKEVEKTHHKNVILTSYFNYSPDPQRGRKWTAQITELMPLINSCIARKQKLIIFSDCFLDSINSEYIKFESTLPSHTHSPNVYRWIVYHEWMQKNSFEKCWMVDSTDVTLQKEPFKIIKPGYLYCGDEHDMKTDNNWMKSFQEVHIKPPIEDYRQVISENAEETLINCGIVGGCSEIIVSLIEKWSGIHKEKTVGLMASTDMAVFNYVVRKHFNDILVHGPKINTKFKHFEKNNNVAIWKHK